MDSCTARFIDQAWKNIIDPCFQHVIQGHKCRILLVRTNILPRYGFTLATKKRFYPQNTIVKYSSEIFLNEVD